MPDMNKATPTDAELILRLYDLRREEVMRKARNWFGGEFWPDSFEEVQSLLMDYTKQENAYFRQVTSYWEMACSLVLRGALDSGLFHDNGGEGAFVYCKVKPFIQQMRAAMNAPEFLAQMERLFEGTPEWRERVKRMNDNLAHFNEMRKKQTRQTAA
jgi:hypothetical protein